jgi:hypothetical protein
MSEAFDSETASLMADALRQALARLKMLGLVDGDADVATKHLSRLIMHAVEEGERDEENLVLFAMGRFQSARTGAERKP